MPNFLTSSGTFLWSYASRNAIWHSSPSVDVEGHVYVGSMDQNVYAVNSMGALLWTYETGNWVYSCPIIGADRKIYVGSADTNFYVFYDQPMSILELNDASFRTGEQFVAIFKLNQPIERQFTAYAVLIMPGGKMLNARTLDVPLKPVASNVNGLPAGFTYPLLSVKVPPGAPKGEYELVAVFFDPSEPITGRPDAFLDVSARFTVM
ncbi:MAG: PQQ-binding-like beta-propeller repeat protein [bacterium]